MLVKGATGELYPMVLLTDTSVPKQNGCHFADSIFKCDFLNDKFCILKFLLKFVPEIPFDKKSALV